jgi:hypothetical protein
MKKNILISKNIFLGLAVLGFLALPLVSLAAGDTVSIGDRVLGSVKNFIDQAYGGGQKIAIDATTFPFGLGKVLNYLISLIGIVFFLGMIYAGYLWMNARGNEEQVEKAKKLMREMIIGLLIIVFARLITELYLFILGQNLPNPNPQ